MDYNNPKHQYLNELAREENMHTRTLRNKIRAAGYNESLRGLLPNETITKIQLLLHPQNYNSSKNNRNPAKAIQPKQASQSNPAKASQPKQSSQSKPAKASSRQAKRMEKRRKQRKRVEKRGNPKANDMYQI